MSVLSGEVVQEGVQFGRAHSRGHLEPEHERVSLCPSDVSGAAGNNQSGDGRAANQINKSKVKELELLSRLFGTHTGLLFSTGTMVDVTVYTEGWFDKRKPQKREEARDASACTREARPSFCEQVLPRFY